MRILLIIPYFYPSLSFGGPVKVAFDAGKELVKRGHEVVVFTSDAKDWKNRIDVERREVEGMDVHYFRNLSMFFVKNSNLFLTPALFRKMKSDLKSFDVLHAHEYTTYQNIAVHYFAKRYGLPYILQAHGSLPKIGRVFRKWLFEVLFGSNLLKSASKVIALSPIEAYQYKFLGVPNKKIVVIPNGIDLSEYTSLPPRGFLRKKFNISENKKMILYLGRIHKTKGIDLLIKAYAYMIKSIKENNTILVMVGPDDGFLSEVKSLLGSLGGNNSVLFTGFLNNMDKLGALVDADLFVTPSFYGFPMTFLEACAAGTPIITTNHRDTLDWIHGNVGYVTPPEWRDLAKAMYSIISDDDSRKIFSKNCIHTVKFRFSLEKIVDKLEQIYEEVAKKT